MKFCLGYTEFPLSSPNINWVCAEHWDYKVIWGRVLLLRLGRETREPLKNNTSVTEHQMSRGTFWNQGSNSAPYSHTLRFGWASCIRYGMRPLHVIYVSSLDEAQMVCDILWQGEGRGTVPPERLPGWAVWAKRRARDRWSREGGLLLRFA